MDLEAEEYFEYFLIGVMVTGIVAMFWIVIPLVAIGYTTVKLKKWLKRGD